ncbi:MAG: glycosyltransferase [Pirellulaceae bacterium]
MAERKSRVAFFTPECRVSRNHVFYSQVLGQANALQTAGFDCMVIGSESSEEEVQKALALPQIGALCRACVLPLYPDRPSSFSFYRVARNAADQAKRPLEEWRPEAIYVRALTSFRAAEKLARHVGARVVYDARGLVAEESILRYGMWNVLAHYHRYRELDACKKADKLLCVSKRFRAYLEQKTDRRDILVVPSCVNESQFIHKPIARQQIRQKLGWSSDSPVVVYCGGLSVWQRTDDVLRLIFNMKMLKPELKCVLLVSDPEKMSVQAAKAGLSGRDCECLRLAHEAIPDWLSAADAGVILRHDVLVNNVASPVKIAEYLACGLPVICSRGIGDLSEMVEQEKVGVVLQGHERHDARLALGIINQVRAEPGIRQRMRELVVGKLSWSAHVDTYRLAYGG